jgi:hypothetical protein
MLQSGRGDETFGITSRPPLKPGMRSTGDRIRSFWVTPRLRYNHPMSKAIVGRVTGRAENLAQWAASDRPTTRPCTDDTTDLVAKPRNTNEIANSKHMPSGQIWWCCPRNLPERGGTHHLGRAFLSNARAEPANGFCGFRVSGPDFRWNTGYRGTSAEVAWSVKGAAYQSRPPVPGFAAQSAVATASPLLR